MLESCEEQHGEQTLGNREYVGAATSRQRLYERLGACLGFNHKSFTGVMDLFQLPLCSHTNQLDNLTVSRIDPHEVTERYREHVLSTKGANLDAEGWAMLEEDLRSPCTEEIAVFQAFSRIIREAGKKFVVMDTAPTGHTLLLLDATGAYHRDIVRQMGETGVHFTTPMMQLQDPKQTKVLLVTLAETTPVLEAANLQADLRRAGIEPWAWVINNSLDACAPASPLLRQRARNEFREIEAVATRHAQRYALVPLMENEPVGVQRLLDLAGHSLEEA